MLLLEVALWGATRMGAPWSLIILMICAQVFLGARPFMDSDSALISFGFLTTTELVVVRAR
jgi:hypothetical protein